MLRRIVSLQVGPKPFPAAQAFGDIWVPVSGGTQVMRIHVG